ncbi:MAG: hypothetical protein EO766_12205 [Hydrotalea sp. AMD]|uniref:hypothetical protein n=1 Tax=Hydrotalea sp. AMD TaxID=2501297 RepID=UPI001026E6B4|nr:hypothetical protein [Hydrotalea sp. AMD]RWZ87280.1 MAG: hypothetical protein EO766_12205 [Hydrotalea sp. AMD]
MCDNLTIPCESNELYLLTYTSDEGLEPDAVSDDIEKLKAKAVSNNGGDALEWKQDGTYKIVAYVEVDDDEFDENGETSSYYCISTIEKV